jgi:PPM family protein phosphatase
MDPDPEPRQFAARLAEGIEEASRRIHARSSGRSELAGMGTTATAAGFLDGRVILGQVGDSRAYLYREGEVIQLTRDQSLVWEMVEAGTMSEAEAETSSQRNILVQAVGTEPDVDVDLTVQPLRRGDVLLVCSDGLSGLVNREELQEVLHATPEPERACRRLVDLANERGSPDNVTVVIARVDGEGLDAPSPGDEVGRRAFDPDER